ATLDTRTRRWSLPGWGPVLLSDTVGFIRDLPHHLVASFKATLEEARQADLLVHVADASSPAALDQIAAVYAVLQELGIEEKDTLLALNKVDQVTDPGRLQSIRSLYPQAVAISATTGEGLDKLAAAVSDALSHDFLDLEIRFDIANGRLLAFLSKYGEVLSRTFAGERATVHCRISRKHLAAIRDHADAEVRPYDAGETVRRQSEAAAARNGKAGDGAVGEVA
ncbi:MAG TPA: GTPase, partial [Lacipirellula sp.]